MIGLTNIQPDDLKETDAILIVTVPTGSTVTATKNGVTLTPTIWVQNADNTRDSAIFSILSSTFDANAWTVTATLGAYTTSDTVTIDSAKEYSMELAFRVPVGYQEVEYIESSGTQWINTGITPNTNTISKIKFMNLEETGNVIFGYYANNDNTDYRFFNVHSKYYFDAPGNRRIQGGTCQPNIIKELEIGVYYIKDLTTATNIISGSSFTFTGNSTITLNYGTNGYSKNRWYYVFIYNGNTLLAELYPCYRITDSVAGMWDRVSETFLTNSGSGSFIVGADI